MEAYIAAIEEKISEIVGIEHLNVTENMSKDSVLERARFVKHIDVHKRAKVTTNRPHPHIYNIFKQIAELPGTDADGFVTLPELPYSYKKLEPTIKRDILEEHHAYYHKEYVDGYNNVLKKFREAEKRNDVDEMNSLVHEINYNGAGHINLCQHWPCLAPKKLGGGGMPLEKVQKQLIKDFGTVEAFQKEFAEKAEHVLGGCGFAFLAWDGKKLRVATAFRQLTCGKTLTNVNQHETLGYTPIWTLDIGFIAYWHQYKSISDFINHLWPVVNWAKIEENFVTALENPPKNDSCDEQDGLKNFYSF